MIKDDYKKELELEGMVQTGDEGEDVTRTQEWLNLWTYLHPVINHRVARDGDFGPQTKNAVEVFQKTMELEVDGVVGPNTWRELTNPMRQAFENAVMGDSVRSTIVSVGINHLYSVPRELGNNEGPWVRAYCFGRDGSAYAWCVGYGLTILDQALAMHGMKLTDHLPNTLSCDTIGKHAKAEGMLIRNADMRKKGPDFVNEMARPGDIILVCSSSNPNDWRHYAMIEKVDGFKLYTNEGNTNDEGSREGFEACNRMRQVDRQNIDLVRLNL